MNEHTHIWVKTGEYQACQPPRWGAKCDCGQVALIRDNGEVIRQWDAAGNELGVLGTSPLVNVRSLWAEYMRGKGGLK